jgi:hypothetical protein
MASSHLAVVSDTDRFEPPPLRRSSGLRSGVARRLPWFRIALGSVAIVAGLAHLAQKATVERRGAADEGPRAGILAAPPPEWRPIDQPLPAYRLDSPELGGLSRSLQARRHISGGREDTLRLGAFDEPAAHLHLVAARVDRAQPTSTFFVDLVRQAASAGLGVARSAQPSSVATKLGPIETAEVVLAGASERACLAFRHERADPGFRLSGWLCGAGGIPVEPARLACLVDRLAVLPDAEDDALKALFAEAEGRRSEACGPYGARAATPVTAARTDSSSRRRGKAPAADSASRGNRG